MVFNLRLTILLRDAIGGSGYTLMLACLSMLDSNFEENLSTLQYATWMNLLTTLFFCEQNTWNLEESMMYLEISTVLLYCFGEDTYGSNGISSMKFLLEMGKFSWISGSVC